MNFLAKIISKIVGIRKPKTESNPLQEKIDEQLMSHYKPKKRKKKNGNKNNKNKH